MANPICPNKGCKKILITRFLHTILEETKKGIIRSGLKRCWYCTNCKVYWLKGAEVIAPKQRFEKEQGHVVASS